MESTVDFINDVGTNVKGTVTTLLTLNYVIGETLVTFLSWIWKVLLDCAINFCQLISILLEDLAIFVAEIGETIVFSAEILNAGIDNIVSGIHFGLFTTLSSLFKLIQGIRHGTVWTISTIYEISYAVGKAVILTVSNLVYGIWRLPVILMITIHDVTKAVLETIGGAGRFTYLAIKEAPIGKKKGKNALKK